MQSAFSAIKPTGNITIGNYLGAIRNWALLQEKYNCKFSIGDLHALTTDNDILNITDNILNTLATLIACGIDPKHSCVFLQSNIPQHSELCWILSCVTSMGELNRMTQFKDKAGKNKQKASLGLYSYPVLMAADILLYKSDLVPVGEDQIQHIELVNFIVRSFNNKFNTDHFKEIKHDIVSGSKRIMSLRDGSIKMSKSDSSDNSRINLTDSADVIADKIRKSKTDNFNNITKDLDDRPEARNLIDIYASFANIEHKKACEELEEKNFSQFKQLLTDLLISKLTPITKEIEELKQDEVYLRHILHDGKSKALEMADNNIAEIKRIIGINL
jgi:tryptophanyl-tRNA synthetase